MKNIYILFVLICAAGTIVIGCKKKKVTYLIEGKVNDETFSTGFANLTLKVEVKKSGNAYYTVLPSVSTDASGNYTISIENDLYENVRISSEPTNYFAFQQIIPYGNLTQDKNVYNLSTTAKSWARLIFNNINPNPNDELSYIKQQGKVDCSECCPSTSQSLFGAVNDTFICINNGNTNYSYLYSVIGTTNNGIMTVYTTAFDTTTLTLNY